MSIMITKKTQKYSARFVVADPLNEVVLILVLLEDNVFLVLKHSLLEKRKDQIDTLGCLRHGS